ncbi:TetR/AcrR family transcriptional regulator [Bacillus siamensis]|uniref:TetR/AcrR family transcriptional regulator n=1 Tax=Bacillus TaxID=1386 RepID=UPI00031D15FB|nr:MULTISPECIES: TetR/AcrR family transcriptional regulator [Bacillus]MBD0408454.1 TetR/AcrR family transcriptional regulator [Bacillus sp. 1021]MEC3656395.1 TetR/AcrR family transcriptional regulator [Bacillus siamensis]MED0773574.1 TetR/AcrR family transcriptional regulator [Bacillus siamensis]MED0775351.1 TetR/AcrR family transcriptional regulator [Bacillus siamensis]MED0781396.1 TetR/AcrR family transcriptional regulator [Bacillus siamensis]
MSYGDSREKILAAATRLFQLQGYYGTGLNQIIKESGAPKGSLYYHFPDGKEQLAIEAVKEMSHYIRMKIKESLDAYPDPAESIQAFLQDLSSQFTCPENFEGFPVGLLAAETALTSEKLQQACQCAYQEWENLFAGKLRSAGFSDEKAAEISTVLNAMIEGGIILSLAKKDKMPIIHISKQIPNLLKT